jgi:hypothetical protein
LAILTFGVDAVRAQQEPLPCLYGVPDAITPYYGVHPVAIYLYLRIRLEGRGGTPNAHGSGMH